MILRLKNGFFIDQFDSMNYSLKKEYLSCGSGNHQTDESDKKTKDFGYFSDVPMAFKRYLRELRKEETENFVGEEEDYLKRLEEIDNSAIEKLKKVLEGKK